VTTTINVLQAITFSVALVLVLLMIGHFTPTKAEPWLPPRDPWDPPLAEERVHSAFWRPWMDEPELITHAPTPWQRVGV
jgi:hypothetical protein